MIRKKYSNEFKEEAVQLVLASLPEKSMSEVARELDISQKTISNWMQLYRSKNNPAKMDVTPSERAEKMRLRRELKRVIMEHDILKKSREYVHARASVKYSYMQKLVELDKYPVKVCCQVLEVSRSGYYKFLNSQDLRMKKQTEIALVKTHLKEIWKRCQQSYGHRRMYKELPEDVQEKVSLKQVLLLMKQLGMEPKKK